MIGTRDTCSLVTLLPMISRPTMLANPTIGSHATLVGMTGAVAVNSLNRLGVKRAPTRSDHLHTARQVPPLFLPSLIGSLADELNFSPTVPADGLTAHRSRSAKSAAASRAAAHRRA